MTKSKTNTNTIEFVSAFTRSRHGKFTREQMDYAIAQGHVKTYATYTQQNVKDVEAWASTKTCFGEKYQSPTSRRNMTLTFAAMSDKKFNAINAEFIAFVEAVQGCSWARWVRARRDGYVGTGMLGKSLGAKHDKPAKTAKTKRTKKVVTLDVDNVYAFLPTTFRTDVGVALKEMKKAGKLLSMQDALVQAFTKAAQARTAAHYRDNVTDADFA